MLDLMLAPGVSWSQCRMQVHVHQCDDNVRDWHSQDGSVLITSSTKFVRLANYTAQADRVSTSKRGRPAKAASAAPSAACDATAGGAPASADAVNGQKAPEARQLAVQKDALMLEVR